MPEIQVDFQMFMPSLSTFYSYFEILKEHNFIHDVKVVEKNGHNLKITRLAYGLPMGASLEYADYSTLGRSLENRNQF